MKFLKNVILLAVVLVLSYYTAGYFGYYYDKLAPGSLSGGWIGSDASWQYIIGFPFAYILFTILGFQTLASGDRNKWTIWLLVPSLLFFGSGDIKHIYLPIILGLIALAVVKLVHVIISRLKRPNPPMVVK